MEQTPETPKENPPVEIPPAKLASLPVVKKKKKPTPAPGGTGWMAIKSILTVFSVGLLCFLVTYIQLKRQRCVFDNVGISDNFRQRGYTDGFIINTVNNLMFKISAYEGELRNISYGTGQDRSIKFSDGTPKKVTGFTGYQLVSIGSLNIQGIPFKALVYIVDKMFGGAFDNYVTMEFYETGNRLSLAVQFNDKREVFTTPYKEETQEEAIYQLCYKAAIFLMEETDPIRLAEYYFASDQYAESIKACIYTIQTDESVENKSRAYFLWALSSPYLDGDELNKHIRLAVKLDPQNHLAAIMSMAQETDSSLDRKIQDLASKNPSNPAIWYNLVDRINPTSPNDSTSLTEAHDKLDRVYRKFIGVNAEDVPSEVHWYFGKKLEGWGKYHSDYLDSAISCYRDALNHETQRKVQSMYKISEYYNAIAYTYQQKAFVAARLTIDECQSIPMKDPSGEFESILEISHDYAHLAVLADSLNPWAWSTLGEYYGLKHMITDESGFLELSLSALTKSYQYGLDIDQYIGGSEPYCFIYNHHRYRYDALKLTQKYFQGPMRQLRKLRLWEMG